ncbi:MAG: SCO family protein [Candidatus Binatia bacterium]
MKTSRTLAFLLVGLLVVVAAIRLGALPGPWSAPALPVMGQVPDFRLVSDKGRAFGSNELKDRAWLASFLYTTCPGPCPRLVERLKVVRRTVPATDLAIVSFSVDPAADTPEVLAAYKSARGIADGDSWTFVTGPPEDVIELVQKGFLTAVERGSGNTEEGAVSHGVRVALIDGKGGIRGFYATDSDEDVARLANDVASLR